MDRDNEPWLTENSNVAEEVPENDEYDDAEAPASAGQFSCAITSGDASQQLAHRVSSVVS